MSEMGGIRLGLSACLLWLEACAGTPEPTRTPIFTAIPGLPPVATDARGRIVQQIPEGGFFKVCSKRDPNIGGNFTRENGHIVLEVDGIGIIFGEGVTVFDAGLEIHETGEVDSIVFDKRWKTDGCPILFRPPTPTRSFPEGSR